MILLKNCRLVKELTEDFAGEMADVLLDQGKIRRLAEPGTLSAETPDEVLDVKGNTLLPGFFDLHTHLYFKHESINALAARSAAQSTVDAISFAQDKLRYGYTTLRDCGCPYGVAAAVRDGIESGMIEGPRVIAGGHCVTPTTRGNSDFGPLYHEFDSASDALRVARQEVTEGADFIKYMATGAVLNIGGDPNMAITTEAELQALVDAATGLGTYVAAHCHGIEGIKLCVKTGVRSIEHATYIDKECVDLILALGNRSFLVPTFAIVWAIRDGIVDDIPGEVRDKIAVVASQCLKNLKYAFDRGVRLGFGTDIDQAAFDRAPFLEFIARREMGLDNLTLLRQATIGSAELIGLESRTGTVKEGKDADLIVLCGKPDEVFEDLIQKPLMVFARGRRFY